MGDASFDLLAVLIGPDAGEGFYKCGFAVIDMAHHADVDLRLGERGGYCPVLGIRWNDV